MAKIVKDRGERITFLPRLRNNLSYSKSLIVRVMLGEKALLPPWTTETGCRVEALTTLSAYQEAEVPVSLVIPLTVHMKTYDVRCEVLEGITLLAQQDFLDEVEVRVEPAEKVSILAMRYE